MIIIYGKELCGWCDRAKKLCEDYKLDYEYRNVSHKNYLNELKEKVPNVKTVPQIYWKDRYIGGYEEFETEIENTIGGFGENAL